VNVEFVQAGADGSMKSTWSGAAAEWTDSGAQKIFASFSALFYSFWITPQLHFIATQDAKEAEDGGNWSRSKV
jgi:hypothetical protein